MRLPFANRIGFRTPNGIAHMPISIRIRFILFVSILVSILFLLVIIMLLLTGTLTAGQKEAGEYFAQSLRHTKADIELDFGKTSMQAVDMSEMVSSSIESLLSDFDIAPSELQSHPEILEKILDSQFERLIFSLEKSGTSGAFIILDATVNPTLENAEASRSTIYIRNTEPNAVSAGSPNMTMLSGFPDIARQRGISLNSVWSMEFDLAIMPDYEVLREAASNSKALHQLYLWSEARPLTGTNEDIMLCIVPLIDENGEFFGVCGFEVSGMLFKLRYSPDTILYKRVTSLLCPETDGRYLMVGNSLCGGDDNSIRTILTEAQSEISETAMIVVKKTHDVQVYRFSTSGKPIAEDLQTRYFVGLDDTLTLLPSDSLFIDRTYSLILLMPESEYGAMLGSNNVRIIVLCASFILIGALMAVWMSRKFAAPIIHDLNQLATAGDSNSETVDPMKTPEIIAILNQIRSRHPQKVVSDAPSELFEDFLKKIHRLTPTEKHIVALFLEEKTTQEVLNTLFISVSTLKTHNSHIYAKLDVVSRDELQLYFRLIEKTGGLEKLQNALS